MLLLRLHNQQWWFSCHSECLLCQFDGMLRECGQTTLKKEKTSSDSTHLQIWNNLHDVVRGLNDREQGQGNWEPHLIVMGYYNESTEKRRKCDHANVTEITCTLPSFSTMISQNNILLYIIKFSQPSLTQTLLPVISKLIKHYQNFANKKQERQFS